MTRRWKNRPAPGGAEVQRPRDGAATEPAADPGRKPAAVVAQPAASKRSAAAAPPVATSREPARGKPSADAEIQAAAHRPGVRAAVCAAALALFSVFAVAAARTHTPTPDEFVYVPAGLYHLRTGDLSFDPTNPPLLKMLMALPLVPMELTLDLDPRARDNSQGWGPWVFGTSFMKLNQQSYGDAFFAARIVIVLFGIGLGALVLLRATELVSPAAALVAVLLYATMPPVVAHSAVATLDVGVTVLLFAALLATSRFATSREWGWAVLVGALFGFAFCMKGTAALFAPLVPVLAAAQWKKWDRDGIVRFVAGGACIAASVWAAILVSYGFDGFPLPAPLVEGVRFQVNASSAGEYPAFLAGDWSQTGWWYYYLFALLVKTPLATLLLAGAGAWAAARRRSVEDLWIVLPPLLLLYVLSFHYAKDYGIRYLLPAFPFLVLLAARGADLLLQQGRRAQIALAVLLLWQGAAYAITGPHQLAYFNELAGGSDRARHLLLDSNLDWGQDLGRTADWFRERGQASACLGYFGHVDPKVYGLDFTFPPPAPAPGLCAISANFLGGYPYAITYAGDRIRGVRAGTWSWFDRLTPIARIGRSIYVFDVKPEDVARLSTPGGAH